MATKFGYVDRDADSRVNWGDIGKSFSDMLIAKRDKGEAEFKALDNLATVASDIEIPLGQNTTANSLMMDTSNDIKSFVSLNNKLWKDQKITTYEYQRRLQNITDNTDLALTAFKGLNKKIANLNESNASGNMSEYTRQNLDKFMKFSSLNDTKIVIQKDGTMVGNKLVPDGKGGYVNSTNPEDSVSLQAFANIFLQDIPKYDYDAELDGIVEGLGDYQYVFQEMASTSKAGAFFKIEDITAMGADAVLSKEQKEASAKFLDAEKKYLKAMLSNPYESVSILMDGVKEVDGVGFENCPPGVDCKEVNKIRQIYTGNSVLEPKLTEEQYKIAEDFLRSQLRSRLDRKVTSSSTGRRTPITTRKTTNNNTDFVPNDFAKYMAMLWYGNQDQVEKSENYLKSLNDKIQKITRTPDGVSIYYKGGKEAEYRPFKNSNGQIIPQKDWLIGNSNYFLSKANQIKDVNTILNTMNFDPNQMLSNVTAEAKSLSSLEVAKNHINSDSFEVTDETFKGFNKNSVKKALTPILNKYTKGAKITTGFMNNITIKIPNQPNLELSNSNSPEENIRLLKEFLSNNVNPEKSSILMQTGEINALPGGGTGATTTEEPTTENKTEEDINTSIYD